jgi:hypothetical protein
MARILVAHEIGRPDFDCPYSPASSPPIQAHVHGYRVQPRRETRSSFKLVDCPVNLDKHLLGHISGILALVQHAVRQIEHLPLEHPYKIVERVAVAGPEPFNQPPGFGSLIGGLVL